MTKEAIQWRKDSLFNKRYWNWTSTCKRENESRHRSATFTKINSKWIIDLNIKCKTIKLLENNIGENVEDLHFGNNFLDTTTKA